LRLELKKDVASLIEKLDAQFPKQTVPNAMGIVYPQYWLQAYANTTFPKHSEVLKEFYGNPHACGVTTSEKSQSMVIAIIFKLNLDAHQGLSKLTMKFSLT